MRDPRRDRMEGEKLDIWAIDHLPKIDLTLNTKLRDLEVRVSHFVVVTNRQMTIEENRALKVQDFLEIWKLASSDQV